jgi:hypothetical protein
MKTKELVCSFEGVKAGSSPVRTARSSKSDEFHRIFLFSEFDGNLFTEE